jgi:hypothetical protein
MLLQMRPRLMLMLPWLMRLMLLMLMLLMPLMLMPPMLLDSWSQLQCSSCALTVCPAVSVTIAIDTLFSACLAHWL